MSKRTLYAVLMTGFLCCIVNADPWQNNYDWKLLNLRTAAQQDAPGGLIGGEGYQQQMDIEFAPSDPTVVYLCTDTSQVWKSVDGGMNWNPKPNGLMSNGGLSLIINQTDPNHVLLAGFDNEGAGIYRTTDGGTTWVRTYTDTGYEKEGLVRGQDLFHQYSDSTYFAGLQNGNGLVLSVNGGADWTPVVFDMTSDIQSNQMGFILNMKQNPHAVGLELWVCSYNGLYIISESSTQGEYHCVEVTAATLPYKISGWQHTSDPANVRTMLDSVVYYSSNSSLRVDFDVDSTNYWRVNWNGIPVSEGTEYVIEGYVKTETLESQGYGGACINAQDSRGYTYGSWMTNTISSTQDWTKVSKAFTVPLGSGTTQLRVMIFKIGTSQNNGTAWYDNIKIYPSSVGPSGNLLVTEKGLEDYSMFNGDTPTAIHFGTNPGEIFLSCGLKGIYKSTDGGQTFSAANSGILPHYIGRNRLNLDGSDVDRELLVAGFNLVGGRGNYISRDGSQTWVEIQEADLVDSELQNDIAPTAPKNENYFSTPTGFSSTDASVLLQPFNCSVIYKSVDSGNTWNYSGEGYSGGRAAGGFSFGGNDPRTTYMFLTDYGPLATHDGGRSWKQLVTPRYRGENTSYVGIIDPDDSNIVICSIGDWTFQNIVKTINGGIDWTQNITGGDASYKFMALDPQNSSTIYLDNLKSIDQGNSWKSLTKSVVAICPGTGAVYAKEQGASSFHTKIFKSIDGGSIWYPYLNEIPVSPNEITEISVSPVNEDKIYAAARYRGVYILQNDNRWLLKNEADGITRDSFGSYHIQRITVDPVNPDVVYIGKLGAWKGHSDGVCVSTDAGDTWTNISGNLSRFSTVWNMKVNPNNDSVYIATSHGTWVMSSLVLNYHFDETSGANVYNDSVYSISPDFSEEGDATRGLGTSILAGQKGSALSFDGSLEAYVELPSYTTALSNITTNFSVESIVWFDDSNALNNGPIVSDRNNYNNWNGFVFRSWYGHLSFYTANGMNIQKTVTSINRLRSGEWYHLVGTFNNGEIKLFVNGQPEGVETAAFTSLALQRTTPLYVGKGGVNPANFKGKIDEVKIYDRTLSESEVLNKYNYYFNQ